MSRICEKGLGLVFGDANECNRSWEPENGGTDPGYGNIRDGPKTAKTLANMCHLAENAQQTYAIWLKILSEHVPFQNVQ
jgi:hypothetical protein